MMLKKLMMRVLRDLQRKSRNRKKSRKYKSKVKKKGMMMMKVERTPISGPPKWIKLIKCIQKVSYFALFKLSCK